jgi:hypothetical protein
MNQTATVPEARPGSVKSSPSTSATISQYLGHLAYRVFIYLVMYLLISIATIGPCFWTWHDATFGTGPRWVARFYAPLLWLCDHFPPLSWTVNTYIDWWIR